MDQKVPEVRQDHTYLSDTQSPFRLRLLRIDLRLGFFYRKFSSKYISDKDSTLGF